MELSDDDWAVINTIKCRPPNNRDPRKSELKECESFLMAQINVLGPDVIILLGNTAHRAFSPGKELQWGVPETLDDGKALLKIYHPAALIYKRSRADEQKEFIDNNRKLWM